MAPESVIPAASAIPSLRRLVERSAIIPSPLPVSGRAGHRETPAPPPDQRLIIATVQLLRALLHCVEPDLGERRRVGWQGFPARGHAVELEDVGDDRCVLIRGEAAWLVLRHRR